MFCINCGAENPENTKFCPSCGAAASGEPQRGAQAEPGPQAYQQERARQDYRYEQTRQPPPAGEKTSEPIAVLCYLGILLLIPLLVEPNSRFIRYHANQGLMLILTSVACGIVAVIPILGWLIAAVGGIFCFVCLILGIINTLKGEMKPLPLIGKFELIKQDR